MKKAYSTPEVEKINFQYRDQVVVASNTNFFGHSGVSTCENESQASTASGVTCVNK